MGIDIERYAKTSMDAFTEYEVGQRLNIAGEHCTIKYVGEISSWPSEVALGLEWDHPERGKNDGSIDDVRYFETKNGLRSGSFIKLSSKKLRGTAGISFVRALCDKYGRGMSTYSSYRDLFNKSTQPTTLTKERDLNVEEIKIGSKVVESYGFEKLDELQSNFQGLEVISLNSSNIGSNGNDFSHDEEIEVFRIVPSLRILDLSFNLFSDLKEVMSILRQTSIENLNLSGNRIANTSCLTGIDPVPNVKKLLIAETYIKDLNFLSHCFPHLEELNLSANELEDPRMLDPLRNLGKLKVLDISYNKFKTIPREQLLQIDHLEKLVINNNEVMIESSVFGLDKITELDLRANSISQWREIDWLNVQFPNLQKLRINDNPISIVQASSDTMNKIDPTTIQIIARMGSNLSSLNRTGISDSERENYELFFLSLLKKEARSFEDFFKTQRYRLLCKEYNIDMKEILRTETLISGRLASGVISLNIKLGNEKSFERQTFKYYSVGSLKGLISSELGHKSVLDFKIYYEITPGLKEYLEDDLTMIQSTGVSDNETIYIEFNE